MNIQTGEDGRKFIDTAPTWVQILPTWKMVAEEAYRQIYMGELPKNGADPHGNRQRFWEEMQRMAETADKWNAYAKENVPVDTAHEEERPGAG